MDGDRLFRRDAQPMDGSWSDLGTGAPTLAAFASLCARSIASGEAASEELSAEAKTLLFAARGRGVLEIKGANEAFTAPARFLAVRVAIDEERWVAFRSAEDPSITIRFLDAFRELCAAGLVMHHIYRDFSLTRAGLERARTVSEDEVHELYSLAIHLSGYD